MVRTLTLAALTVLLAGAGGAAAAEPAPAPARIVAPVDSRSGPGAYYAAGARLLAGASVRITHQRGGWAMAEVEPKRSAWIPAYALDRAQADVRPGAVLRAVSKDMLRALTNLMGRRNPPPVSRVAVTLGIRGFNTAYAAHRGQKAGEADAQLWESAPFEPGAYEAFVASRFAGRDWESLKQRLPLDRPAPVGDPESDKLGGALAGYVARQDGLIRNPALEAYLGQIAMLVAESSHAYDLPVRVYVLNNASPAGFVSPNGIVFVSAGALQRMRSEAEFAFFVGHEIAHIAFQHGLRKLGRDEARVQEEGAFEEMEQELGWDQRTGDRYVRTAQELSHLADQIHDYFAREDNDRDELEADYWGLLYAARAGYVPEAAEALLVRMVAADGKGGSGLLWDGVPRALRLDACRRTFERIKLERAEFRTFDAEFQAAAKKR